MYFPSTKSRQTELIKITCNTINTTIIGDKTSLTRALDITPNISPITDAKPYTDSTLTVSFTN